MSYARTLLSLILIMGVAFSFNISTASYTVGSFTQGSAGGNLTCPDYDGRSTTTYQQPGRGNATTTSYNGNIGWFETNISITTVNHTVENATIWSITNASNSHSFLINSSADSEAGGGDISSSNISIDYGACAQVSNSVLGNTHYFIWNCSNGFPAIGSFAVGFTGSTAIYNETALNQSGYPDHNVTLGQPFITPNPASTSSTLTCNDGVFNDTDGDLINVSASIYSWAVNGNDTNITTQTIGPGNYTTGDNVSCNQTAYAINWTTSNGTNTSNNITISGANAPVIEILYPANSSSFLGINGTCSFLVIANISFSPGSTNKTAMAILYIDGIYQSNMSILPNASGNYSFNFTDVTQGGIYNVSVSASDSYGNATNQSAWATMGRMGGCLAAGATANLEYPIVSLIILAITMIFFIGWWDTLNPFLAPLSNLLGILGLMNLGIAILSVLQLTPSGAYDPAYYIVVFTFVAMGFYLGLRMIVMAWTTLKAVLWR